MLKVGLTGGIGSGKTSVSDLFENLGVPVIDTDIIAHDLVDNNTEVLQEIADTFGQDMLNLDGCLNRKKLAQIVFKVKENKQRLENILHPKIQHEVITQLHALASTPKPPAYAIIVIPLLIEAHYHDLIDRVLVVMSDEETRVKRVQQRDSRSVSEIQSIINNQTDDQKRQQIADDIIENNSNIKYLAAKVAELHEKYIHLATTDG